ncbi:MAG: arsenate reductase family protein [Cyclobacteriaceae bacterium]
MKKIYHLKSCSTCQRILKELNLTNVVLQNIKEEPITVSQIEEMKKIAGSYEALFSRKAMKYRALGLNEKELSEENYKQYILEEYTFLKRPVALIDDKIFIGNSKKVVEELKNELA